MRERVGGRERDRGADKLGLGRMNASRLSSRVLFQGESV